MSRRIIEYRLVKAIDKVGIRCALGDDWQPWGSPVRGSEDLFQPMVKYAEEPESDGAVLAYLDETVAHLREHGRADDAIIVESLAVNIRAGTHRKE